MCVLYRKRFSDEAILVRRAGGTRAGDQGGL